MTRRTFLLAGAAARGAAGQGVAGKGVAGKDPVFGTTVYSSTGFTGKIYYISSESELLPRMRESRAVGTLYASSLEVMPQSFTQGFPGITDRREWFAIDYRAKVWIARPGLYRFALLSDDGAKFWINEKLVIDNDGLHAPLELAGSARLSRGLFSFRIAYFQGPRFEVALVFSVRPPGEAWSVFHTDRYVAPAAGEHPAGEVTEIKRASNW
ncbi:MAG: PA14 domain-containing protein [Acidobacteriota bacterium]